MSVRIMSVRAREDYLRYHEAERGEENVNYHKY